MNNEIFDKHVEFVKKRIESTLQTKAKEYAKSDNRFHNFDRASKLLNTTRERALLGFMTKHWVSILDIVDGIDRCDSVLQQSMVSEKISDSINYLVLLEAMIYDRIERNTIRIPIGDSSIVMTNTKAEQ